MIKHISEVLKYVYTIVISVMHTPSVGGETGYVLVAQKHTKGRTSDKKAK
jgi:hypothetical protein